MKLRIEVIKGRAHWKWQLRDTDTKLVLCASTSHWSNSGVTMQAADNFLAAIGKFAGRKWTETRLNVFVFELP